MTDIELLTHIVNDAMNDIENCDLDMSGLSEEFKPLGQAIGTCLSQVREVYKFTASISDGNFKAPIPDRHNYFVGPSKDLFYMLKHLTWQAEEVAKGDYSQHVDFLGSFSTSFNFMITELERREKRETELAEEKLRAVKKQNAILRQQMERQMFHYQSYKNFIWSYLTFRDHYKQMMGEVYSLFNEGRYEDGRLLVAKINDMMAAEVMTEKDYSNNDFLNIVMSDIAGICKKKNVPFSGQLYVPVKYQNFEEKLSPERIFNMTELIASLLDIEGYEGQEVSVTGGEKNGWFSMDVVYTAQKGKFPPNLRQCLLPAGMDIVKDLEKDFEKSDSLMNVGYFPKERKIEIVFNINAGE